MGASLHREPAPGVQPLRRLGGRRMVPEEISGLPVGGMKQSRPPSRTERLAGQRPAASAWLKQAGPSRSALARDSRCSRSLLPAAHVGHGARGDPWTRLLIPGMKQTDVRTGNNWM